MTTQSVRLRQHPELPNPVSGSGGEGFAALTATRRNDCTTRTGPHTKTEAVNARAASVVRLERPLALGHGQHSSKFIDASRRHGSNIGENSGVHPQGGDGTTSKLDSSQHETATSPQGDCSRVLTTHGQVKLAHLRFPRESVDRHAEDRQMLAPQLPMCQTAVRLPTLLLASMHGLADEP